ncbi:MAG: UPF0179 family protein [Thermoproteota archaeon]
MGKYSYWDPKIGRGSFFTYLGETYECEACVNRAKCHGSLSMGFSYRIVRETGGEKIHCTLRGGEVAPFEITVEPLTLLAPWRVKEGAVTRLENSFCKTGCSRISDCPILLNMLVANRRVRVVKKLGAFDCPVEKLILVEAEVLE